MKKLISLFTVLFCILSGCLWFSTDTYADETKSSDSETAASETVPETQASPVILPTDKVSTDDIILYSSAACVIDVDSGEILYYKNMDKFFNNTREERFQHSYEVTYEDEKK